MRYKIYTVTRAGVVNLQAETSWENIANYAISALQKESPGDTMIVQLDIKSAPDKMILVINAGGVTSATTK